MDFQAAFPARAYEGQIPLFMLHGYGSNEADMFMLAADLPGSYYPIAVRAPLALPWGGYAWFALEWISPTQRLYDKEGMLKTLKALEQWIHRQMLQLQATHLRPALLGFSQGGMMSCALISRRPGYYGPVALMSTRRADAVPLPAAFPPELRVFMSHGLYDDVIPVEEARQSVAECREAGLHIDYKEYPQGHYLSEDNIRDLAVWLEDNKRYALL